MVSSFFQTKVTTNIGRPKSLQKIIFYILWSKHRTTSVLQDGTFCEIR